MSRTSIIDFAIANNAYGLSTVTVYVANPDGSKGALATLYAGQTGAPTLPNPQTLDATGKWQQPVYISDDVILEIDSPTASLDADSGIVSFGGKWRGEYVGGGTKYYRGDRILGPTGEAEEDNVYISQSIWTSTDWATDVADASKIELELDYQALKALAMAAVPLASEAVAGRIEIATTAETNTGTDDARAITPLKLSGRTATETRSGIAEVATQTETNTGANDTTMVTPAKLHARVSSEALQGLIAIGSQADADAGANDTKAITPLKLWTTPMRGGWRNILNGNAGLEIWQRGAGGTASFAVAASADVYTADRWFVHTGANQASTVSQQAGLVSQSGYCARVQRNAGQTGTVQIRFAYPLDTDEILRLRGGTASLQFKARAGADWSPASGTLLYRLLVGTGPVMKRNGTAYTGETSIINNSVDLAPGAAAITRTQIDDTVIPSDITQAELSFVWTPVGAAGANDWIELDDIELRVSEPVIDQVERRPFDDDLRACFRHYWKTFDYAVAPAENSGSLSGALTYRVYVAGVSNQGKQIDFPVPMRINNPAIIFFNPSAAGTNWRNTTDAANSGASTAERISARGFFARNAQVAGDTLTDLVDIHASADAGI